MVSGGAETEAPGGTVQPVPAAWQDVGRVRAHPPCPPMFDQAESPVTSVIVERVLYSQPEDAFAVVRVRPETGAEAFVAAGPLPLGVAEGDALKLEGAFEEHPRFGRRFKVQLAHPGQPVSEEGIRRYLRGGRVKGIGKKLADRIVDHFGAETLEILEHAPERLREIEGVGDARVAALLQQEGDGKALREALVRLHELGLGPAQAMELAGRLGEHEVIAKLSTDPYGFVGRLPRYGFQTADRIAQGFGLGSEDPARLSAALVHQLGDARQQGHVAVGRERLVEAVTERLNVPPQAVERALERAAREGRVSIRLADLPPYAPPVGPLVYLPELQTEEEAAAEALINLAAASEPRLVPAPDRVDPPGLRLSAEQDAAVREVLASRVALLTGGPGVGKTTVLKAIIRAWEGMGLSVTACAPTGRAARRLAEATERDAGTIHRTFGIRPGARDRGDALPLEADAVVIDEASMLDLPLLAGVLRRLAPGTLLLLVGDPDQLPSVGPGNVLGDLIASHRIPVVRLTRVFRQAMDSWIVRNAHRVLAGKLPTFPARGEEADCFFAERDTGAEGQQLVLNLLTQRIPKKFGFDPRTDVQVLSPMHRGPTGVQALNEAVQHALSAGTDAIKGPRGPIHRGDRVMQVRNDHDRELMNGEIGTVTSVDVRGGRLEVRFDNRVVAYEGNELQDLTLAWAVTVHKSQGAEFPAVILTLFREHHLMLRRAILYTAMTRARRLLVIVGSRGALESAVKDARAFAREGAFEMRLKGHEILPVPLAPERDADLPSDL